MKPEPKIKERHPKVIEIIERYTHTNKSGYDLFKDEDFKENTMGWGLLDSTGFSQYVILYEQKGEGFLMVHSKLCSFTGSELDQINWENLKLSLPFRSVVDETETVATIYWTKIEEIGHSYLEWILSEHLRYSKKLQEYLIEKYRI